MKSLLEILGLRKKPQIGLTALRNLLLPAVWIAAGKGNGFTSDVYLDENNECVRLRLFHPRTSTIGDEDLEMAKDMILMDRTEFYNKDYDKVKRRLAEAFEYREEMA